uniref:HDAg domain-containing protein n=1 Tax=Anopheles funestus TaxID=62324 RepID=A0A182R7L9_ANOFN
MANVRDSDISLWLHNKLGTSNDSWISGSITSQLNKEVLRNIKECFPDLQTQVKLKLLLSFFQIPRRIVEEWKTELEEVIEVAGLDSELWVSMIAETIKTFPTTGSLNTEISDYEETRPIFTDMVNELRRLVVKNADLGMLPLECQYLNKSTLVSVVGQQATPVKHFTLKRKPKSAALRAELLQKSSDAQSCLKKISAPTVPLRSRGIPRKMTDTTPLKGIPSRVPTGGFRSPPTTPGQTRPAMSRTQAGRKDGGIKLLEIGEQPLGYAAAKKRKREQEKEEQAKKVAEQQSQSANDTKSTTITATTSSPTVTTTPDYAAGLSAPSTVYSQPATPMPATSGSKDASSSVMSTSVASSTSQAQVQQPQPQQQQPTPSPQTQLQPPQRLPQQTQPTITTSQQSQQQQTPSQTTSTVVDEEEEVEMKDIKAESISLSTPVTIPVSAVPSVSSAPPPLAYPATKTISATVIKTEPSGVGAGTVGSSMVTLSSQPPSLVRTVPLTPKQAKSVLQTQSGSTGGVQIIQKSTGKTISAAAAAAAAVTSTSNTNAQQKIEIISSESIVPGTLHASIPKSTTIINRGGNILFTTKQVQPGTTTAAGGATIIQQKTPLTSYVLNTTSPGKQLNIQRIVSNASSAGTPSLTTTISRAPHQQQLLQQQSQQIQVQGQQSATQQTRIVQIKTAPTVSLNNNQLMQNIPPLISTQIPAGSNQPTILNIQSMQQQQGQQNQLQITPTAVPQKRTITITAQNPPTAGMTTSVAQILQHQQQLQQQQQQQQQQQALQATAAAAVGQQPKYTQVVMPPNVKGNTYYVTNAANVSNVLNQKGVIIQTVDASGNTVYQQIPLQNVSGLSGATILTGPPGLIKTESETKLSQIPALVPTSSLHQNIPALTPVVIQPSGGQQQGTTVVQQQQQQGATIPALITNISQQQVQQQQQPQVKQQVIFRPVGGANNVQTILPQGITLIQRPGGQPKLVQTIQQTAGAGQQQQLLKAATTAGQAGQRTIITQIPQQQQQQAQQQHTIQFQAPGSQRTGGTTIQLVQQPQQQGQTQQIQVQRAQLKQVQQQQQGTTVTIQQQSQGSGQQQQSQQAQQQQAGGRKGLSISSKYYMEAHDMFKRANCVSRLEKAIIIGFMAGYRNNPRPSPENIVTIKLNESVEKVHQDDRTALMLVESLITLDYNTGQWRTFRKYREVEQSQQLAESVSSDTTATGAGNTATSGGSGTTASAGQQNSVVI